MPYRNVWVRPPLFLTRKGVKVFHCFRHDNADDVLLTYHFATDDTSDEHQFDVRDLPGWAAAWAEHKPNEEQASRAAIRAAIDARILKQDEEPLEEGE